MAEGTNNRLLDAAVEVFAESGYDGAGVAEIARRAGLTTGAIYSRYRGKADLLLEALTLRLPDEIDRVLSQGDTPGDISGILSALGSTLLELENSSGDGLLLEAFAAARRESDVAARLRHRLDDEEQKMSKLVEEAKAEGLFDPQLDTLAVVRFCHSIGLGMFLSRVVGLPMPEPDHWHDVIGRVIDSATPRQADPPNSSSPNSLLN